MGGPLEGIRVLELCHAIAGPHSCQILADHGADVIKIEPPAGERSRIARPMMGAESLYFACHNRGKRSITLDLKSTDGLDALMGLVEGADVIVTNYTGGVPDRLGWGWEAVSARNPKLVYAHITGFGLADQQNQVPAYDGTIQAMSGFPYLTGQPGGDPLMVGSFVADHIAAFHAAIGVLLALQNRQRTGRGSLVDVSMFDTYFSMMAHDVQEAAMGLPRSASGNRVPTCFTDSFPAADGQVLIAVLDQRAWERLARATDNASWAQSIPYLESFGWRRDSITLALAEWTRKRTRAEIVALLTEAGVPCGEFRTLDEVAASELASGQGRVRTVESPLGQKMLVPGRPLTIEDDESPRAWKVPALGEHTDEVLGEMDPGGRA